MLARINFLSEALSMQTNVTVCLPSASFADKMTGKNESYVPGTRFQTLYLLHGGFGDDSDYVNFTNVTRYADEHKVAVIMPNGYNSFYENQETGALPAKFWDFVSDELPRVCQTMFPLSTERDDTFVAGLSMGAHGAMKLAVHGGDRFHTAVLMSGAGMDTQAAREPATAIAEGGIDEQAQGLANSVRPDVAMYREAKQFAEEGKRLTDIVMTCGSDDFLLPAVHTARDLLTEYGYSVTYEEVPGFGHEWDFWDLSLRRAFEEWLPLRHDVILP
ncbi:alpha/beta hydrolase [Microterricola viridarii]|uniref:S-formylglutathione hydrolase FrmB n=1 Tax=Microterricola viridarii TaxID=412690 RepID=A0A0Y0NYE5_9MICO|nr:alpha/beta hydrolase-fold protein [Microterricola viridarii]AMB59804.1 hypothetical protein AWU67_14095 [Microterricola viridarii]